MFDILVDGNVVAVVVPSVVKLFVKTLVDAVGMSFKVESRPHVEPAESAQSESESKPATKK